MIDFLRGLWWRISGRCHGCGQVFSVDEEATAYCWDCSLSIVEDYDQTSGELLVTVSTEKPVYHEEKE